MPEVPVTRRDFTRRLTFGTGLALSASGVAADEPRLAEAGAQPPAEQPPPEPEDFVLAALVREYPSEHLTEDMLAGIRAGLRRNRQQAEQLRAAGLANTDEPAFVFRAYRKE
jgi:hypothetical protein